MSKTRAIRWAGIFVLLIAGSVRAASTQGPLPLKSPAISRTQVAFVSAEKVWVVSRQGGEARRLTEHTEQEGMPVFSPDGSQVAFARNTGGNVDVYVVALKGGELRRLTYHPTADIPRGWTPDGKKILFASYRHTNAGGDPRLFTISSDGGFPDELPFPMAWFGSFSPAAERIAYMPLPDSPQHFAWRDYRGGATSKIWIGKLADSSVREIPRDNSNDMNPMWIGGKIYFISDRAGTTNLFLFDTVTNKISQLTRFEGDTIKAAAASDDAIVFIRAGELHLYDLKTGRTSSLDVRLKADRAELAPRTIKAAAWIRSADISATGDELLFGARGEVLKFNVKKGESQNLTATSGVAERSPVWSPDGRWIAYFSDESGEYQLHIRAAREGQGVFLRKIAIEARPSFYRDLSWSPDSRKLSFSDKRLALWFVDLENGKPQRVDTSTYSGENSFDAAWSPDSNWLAYSKHLPNRLRGVFVHSFGTGKNYPLTNNRVDAQSPIFDAGGKYLYFISEANAGTNLFGMSRLTFSQSSTRSIRVISLRDDGAAKNGARESRSGNAPQAAFDIDLENIGQRSLALPFPLHNSVRIAAGRADTLLALIGSTLYKFNSKTRLAEEFAGGVSAVKVSADGNRLLLVKDGNWVVAATEAPTPDSGRIDLSGMEIRLEPGAEWRQMYFEAWRLMRDYFFDPGLHGINQTALKEKYARYLPNVTIRADLNDLFEEMFANVSTSHLTIGGGEMPRPTGASGSVGLLGADFRMRDGHYQITRIYRGQRLNEPPFGPLSQPGIDVSEGDYLLAVDGVEIKTDQNLYRYFLDKAERPVQLKVGRRADGVGARIFTVNTLEEEYTVRHLDWVEDNRRKVEELSGGKLAYIYLPDTSRTGFETFNREFYTQLDKRGIVIDERFNAGGEPADYIVETLKRTPLSYYAFREGEDWPFPLGMINGPKVMITNEAAASGGDTLPWMFRQAQVGVIVGKRTQGAGIGHWVSAPSLIDGGIVRPPNRAFYNPQQGTWDIENRGVAPDFDVEFWPADWRAGHDTQLEKAIVVALEKLRTNPPQPPKRPRHP